MTNQKRIEQIKKEFKNVLTECFDFSIMDGWAEIVYDLLREIRDHYPNVKVLQIKEKFGGLRFYINQRDNDNLYEIIRNATDKSYNICEFTGKEGKLRTVNGWYKTACEEIYQKALEKNTWIFDDESSISR